MGKRDIVTSFLSIILIILGVLTLMLGLLVSTGLIQSSSSIRTIIYSTQPVRNIIYISSYTGFGVALIVFSIIYIVLGYGIWKLTSWIYYLGVMWAVFSLSSTIYQISILGRLTYKTSILGIVLWLFTLIWLIYKRRLFIKK